MHLLNINSLSLYEFGEDNIPPYAILSHRWGDQELTFKEISKKRTDTSKRGYLKLQQACKIAVRYAVSYLWLDTACIDKTSSAELSEAINSMYKWYQESKVCIAYLEDVSISGHDFEQSFKKSVWFSRSWTLQELLAPKRVELFDGAWVHIGSRESHADRIAEATRIPAAVLEGHSQIWDCSIAERMSWASQRKATRPEDIAYSLLGIFDINMPPLYGEGTKAFTRLQEEIIRHSTDATFLLWGHGRKTISLLASSPADFAENSGQNTLAISTNTPFNLTNIGLEIEASVVRWAPEIYGLVVGDGSSCMYAVLLKKYPWLDAMYRVDVQPLHVQTMEWSRNKKVIILKGNREQRLEGVIGGIDVDSTRGTEYFGFEISQTSGIQLSPHSIQRQRMGKIETEAWSSMAHINLDDPTSPFTLKLECTMDKTTTFFIELSFDFDSRPCALLYKGRSLRNLWTISDTILQSNKTVHNGQDYRECQFTSMTENHSDEDFYFLRATDHDDIFAKLPGGLVAAQSPAWVRFIPPWRAESYSQFWTFSISNLKPTPPPMQTTLNLGTTMVQSRGGALGVEIGGNFLRIF